VIIRVPRTKGTTPLIITISEILSRIMSIRAFRARFASPRESQITGVRISFRMGLRMRFSPVKIRAITASSARAVGTTNPGTKRPTTKRQMLLIRKRRISFPIILIM